jgi:hypothetical protein
MRAAPALLLPLLATGCGGSAAQHDVAGTASSFQSAVAASDFTRACSLLSPQVLASFDGSCPDGLKQAGVPTVSGIATTEVYGQNGLVRWRGGAVFVSRFPSGWKVIAAGCSPSSSRPDQPYHCSVSGG